MDPGAWGLGLGAGAWFFVFGTWIWPWVGAWRLEAWGLGICARHYVICSTCYVSCNIRNVCISLVLSTFCYVLYVMCCVLRVMSCPTCVYFLGFKHMLPGAMCYVFCTTCCALWEMCVFPWSEAHFAMSSMSCVAYHVLCMLRNVCISLVLSTFLEMCLGL